MFLINSKTGFSLKHLDFDGELHIKIEILPNTKIVRMAHRNLFYDTDLKVCDQKRKLWRKTKILRRWGNLKFRIGVQNWTFEGCFEVKMILKNILKVPTVILAQFPSKIIVFPIILNENL